MSRATACFPHDLDVAIRGGTPTAPACRAAAPTDLLCDLVVADDLATEAQTPVVNRDRDGTTRSVAEQPRRTAREVTRDRERPDGELLEIDHAGVSGLANRDGSSTDAEEVRRLRGQSVYRGLERDLLLIAHEPSEEGRSGRCSW